MKERRSYSSNNFELEIPNLLQVQKNSYKNFLQLESSSNSRKKAGLEKIFRDIFPVTDVKEQYALSYLGYNIGTPKYSISECRERGLTYSVPLYAKLNLKIFEDAVEEGKEKLPKEERINDVFICDLPQMTNEGSFIINGAERVVVSQLHRSPGVSFDEEYHTNGAKIWKSRIIPYRGSWVEFQIDPNEALYVSIDRRKKFPATILIKALSAFAAADVVNANSPSQHKASDFEGDDGGYSAFKKSIMSNEDLLNMFYEKETITITDTNAEDFIGKILFTDAIDTEQTGEIVAEANSVLDQEILNRLLDAGINKIEIISKDINAKKVEKDDDMEEEFSSIIHNTLALDTTKDCEEALAYVYTQLRQGDSPNLATAKSHFGRIFFNAKQYDLGEVGRYRLNSRLGINVNLSRMVITSDDFMAIIGYMVGLANGTGVLDDIDHLGNRRARSVGELLSNQLSVGLTRMARAIKDRLTLRDQEEITPNVLVNSRTVSSVVNQFFGSSQLSQFMDQTNPLAEITHKRRMSALGPGGLTRERAGFEVRDVHHTHYGRLCPIETPEGPNIGLINSLATYSIINHFGFLETPYRIVGDVEFKSTKDETVFIPELKWHFDVFRGFTQEPELFVKEELTKGEMSGIRSTLDKIQKQHFDDFANKVFKGKYRDEIVFMKNGKILHDYDGKADYIQSSDEPVSRVTTFIIYLTADSEDHYKVAPASTILTESQEFRDAYVILRAQGEFPVLPNSEVELMDVSQKQIVSIAAGLIPFLEHDDANRALMGSNMQRQAVPLLRSQAPVVGTGMERRAALDSGSCILSQFDGVVDFVDASKIIVKREEYKEEETFLGLTEYDTYILRKYERSNQETCINQKPIVFVGDKVKAGDVLADGASTDQGELALGKNIRIAFLPWNGYNYEDAIIISEELVKKDVFTSIHIEEFEVEVRDTKRGPEELTRQIPNVSEEAVLNLDEDGVIRVGAELEHGDIIVGKVTPKGETELSPEERLLRAIFGEKAGDVRDTSLKAPPGMKGVVIHTRTFTRKDKSASKATEQELIRQVQQDFIARISKIEQVRESRLAELLIGQTSGNIIRTETNEVLKQSGKKITEATLGKINFNEIALNSELSNDAEVNAEAIRAIKLSNSKIEEYQEVLEKEINKITKGDELKPGVQKTVKVYVAKKRTLQIGDKMAGRHGNKGVISKVVPVEDMPFTKDGEPVQIMLNPLGVPSRMNVGQVLEVHLGWAAMALGIKVATPVFDGATFDEIQDALVEAGFDKSGKTKLIDGRTGEYFKSEVTVGYMYMLKLGHLVSDKMHARSIGPYSLVTQQPLGGKSQFGGQRFGEMEVWAMEAYGAAYTLQELLTVKSDDVIGRSKIYEAIVKGENTPSPGIPESFRVLIKEIRALGLYIKTGDES